MVTISVVNNKGGVGKSTIACSLAQALALVGQNVLCVDLDNQCNLTTMLGISVARPRTVRDLFKIRSVADKEAVAAAVAGCILQTSIEGLHCISAPEFLADDDVGEEKMLSHILQKQFMPIEYDFIIIDNHPGISRLQRASLHAADYVLIPTELQQLAMNGLSVMMLYLTRVFHFNPDKIRIIINKYRQTIRQDAFFAAIHNLFPKSATVHAIPMDSTFDEIITENKILFLDRLKSSKAAPLIVGLMSEIFPFAEDRLYEDIQERRNRHLADNARLRFFQAQNKNKESQQ
jgi:chromosome partitioning protein